MMQNKAVLAKTRTYMYLVFACEFLNLFARPLSSLTGFGLKKMVFGFIALTMMQTLVIIMYNLKITSELISKQRRGVSKKVKNKNSKKQEDITEEMLNCAARIRVFMIATGIILILQALAFQFIGEALFEAMLIVTEITCLILSLQNLTKLQRMI